MLRTKSTIIEKITTRQNSGNATYSLKIQRNIDASPTTISTLIDQILRPNFNLPTPSSAGNGKSTIPEPYGVPAAGENQES